MRNTGDNTRFTALTQRRHFENTKLLAGNEITLACEIENISLQV
jgi:hypothetical protein